MSQTRMSQNNEKLLKMKNNEKLLQMIQEFKNNNQRIQKVEKPQPKQKPLFFMTNSDHYCYDCEKLLTPDCQKGSGLGLLGINLYFCSDCYLKRYHRNEGIIINFSQGYSNRLLQHYRKEFEFFFYQNKNHCFSCSIERDLYQLKGFLNHRLTVCVRCYYQLDQQLKDLSSLINQYDILYIKGEIKYYRKFINQRIKEKF